MTLKAVDMVRKIRDQQYDDMKSMSRDEQIKYIQRKAAEGRKKVRQAHHLTNR